MTYQQKNTYGRLKASMATPPEQVAILLEKVAQEIKKAQVYFEQEDYQAYFLCLEKSLSILNGLCGVISPKEDMPQEVKRFAEEMESVFAGMSVQIALLDKENYQELCPVIAQAAQDTARLWRASQKQDSEEVAVSPPAPKPEGGGMMASSLETRSLIV